MSNSFDNGMSNNYISVNADIHSKSLTKNYSDQRNPSSYTSFLELHQAQASRRSSGYFEGDQHSEFKPLEKGSINRYCSFSVFCK